MRFNLASMPAAPYAREGRNNVPHRRTVRKMRQHAEARGARDFGMFRTGAGRAANGFCHFTDRHFCRVARYHETDILTITPEGDIIIRFDGWHTLRTRERFNAAAEFFNLPLRAVAVGKADVTGFRLVGEGGGKVAWHFNDGMGMDGDARGPLGYRELRIPAAAVGLHSFEFSDGRETYRVSPFGHITRECLGWRYSGGWTMRGLVQRDNFGNVSARVQFANLAAFINGKASMTYGNGKPRWHVEDIDHGTARRWGAGIRSIRIIG